MLKGTQKRVRQLLGKRKLAIWQKGRSPNVAVQAEEKAAYDQVCVFFLSFMWDELRQ